MRITSRLLKALLCCFCVLSGCIGQQYAPEVNHEVMKTTTEKIRLIWSRDNIYTVWSTFATTIDASNHRICFLGGLESSIDNSVICLNSSKGELLWQSISGNHSAIAVMPDGVFVAYRNIVGVRRYDSSGQVIWEKHLSGTGSNYLYVVDDQIQILTVPESFWILDFNGNEIKKFSGDKVFISTPDETFIESSGIQLQKTSNREIVWQYHEFDDVLEMAPLFTSKKIFVRTGQASGSIFTLNRATGDFLWKTNNNIISNVAYSPSKKTIYALTRDGKLLAIDENDGEADTIAEFSSVPFILNGEANFNVGSYQLAYDANTNILFVSLGDSRQMFAFEEQ